MNNCAVSSWWGRKSCFGDPSWIWTMYVVIGEMTQVRFPKIINPFSDSWNQPNNTQPTIPSINQLLNRSESYLRWPISLISSSLLIIKKNDFLCFTPLSTNTTQDSCQTELFISRVASFSEQLNLNEKKYSFPEYTLTWI